jgi:hypothetical protein
MYVSTLCLLLLLMIVSAGKTLSQTQSFKLDTFHNIKSTNIVNISFRDTAVPIHYGRINVDLNANWSFDTSMLQEHLVKHKIVCANDSNKSSFQRLIVSSVPTLNLPIINVWVVGDSLSLQIYWHLRALSISNANPQIQIQYHLVGISMDNQYFHHDKVFMNETINNFINQIDNENSVVIYNEGSWWEHLVTPYWNRTRVLTWYEEATSLIMKKAKNFKGTFFFRSILPVHAHCPTRKSEEIANMWAKRWTFYDQLNIILSNMTRAHNFTYLDFTSIFEPHYDMHQPNDCMHYCVGPNSPLTTAASHLWVIIIRYLVKKYHPSGIRNNHKSASHVISAKMQYLTKDNRTEYFVL